MTSATHATRTEAAAQLTIMLIMGVTAACASFNHIHDLSVAHGQPSWIGWANAVVVELMSITAGLELRRRKRSGQSSGFVPLVLYTAALVSLAAQVAEAEPSVWGWIVAALPALGFLAVVKIVLSRNPVSAGPNHLAAADTEPDRHEPDPRAEHTSDSAVRSASAGPISTPRPGPTMPMRSGPVQVADRTVDLSSLAILTMDTTTESTEALSGRIEHQVTGPARSAEPSAAATHQAASTTPVRRNRRRPERHQAAPPSHDEHPADLLEVARSVAADLHKTTGKVTRNGLARGIRRKGHSISTDRASALWRHLHTDASLASIN